MGAAKVVKGNLLVKGQMSIDGKIVNRTASPILSAGDSDNNQVAMWTEESFIDPTDTRTSSLLGIVGASATIKKVYAGLQTAPLGDATCVVTLTYAGAGEAEANVLSSPITLSSSHSDAEMVEGTLSVTALDQFDMVFVDVTSTTNTGTKGDSLIVVVYYEEEYA